MYLGGIITSYASTVLDSFSPIPGSGDNVSANVAPSSFIASITKYKKGTPKLYSTITPGAYELSDIADLV